MGIYRRLKEGIQEMKGASYNNYDKSNHPFGERRENILKARQKAEKLKEKQELYEERERGRREGAKQRAYNEGKKAGKGGGSSGFGGGLRAVSYGLQNTERVFGFGSGGSGGIGMSENFFGIGGSSPAPKPRAKSTRIVTDGKVITIRETAPVNPVKKVRGGSNWMEDLDRDSIF